MENPSTSPASPSTGPWHVELNPDGNPFITNGQRKHVCVLCTQGDPEIVAANANLLAAAPDLLSACKDILATLQRHNVALPETQDVDEAIVSLHEAIEKAQDSPLFVAA